MSLLFSSANSIARRSVSATGCGAAGSCAPSGPPEENPTIAQTTRRTIPRMVPPRKPKYEPHQSLFVAQRFNRLQSRGLVRRQISKKEAGGAGYDEGDNDAHAGNGNAQAAGQEKLRGDGNGQPDENADDGAAAADQ